MTRPVPVLAEIANDYLPDPQNITRQMVAEHIVPRLDNVLDRLPVRDTIPDPEEAAYLRHRFNGIPYVLGAAPRLSAVYAYAKGAKNGAPELHVSTFANGAAALVIGEDWDRVRLPELWRYILEHARTAIHTHPIPRREAGESLRQAALPSADDLVLSEYAVGRSVDHIAHIAGLTEYTSSKLGASTRRGWGNYFRQAHPGAADVYDIDPEELAATYEAFVNTVSEVRDLPWMTLDLRSTLHNLAQKRS